MTDLYGGFGPKLVGAQWALFAVATILILLRLISFFFVVKRKGGWALWWAIFAWVLATVANVLYTYCAKYGLGNHVWIVGKDPILSTAEYYEWIADIFVCFSDWFSRLSAVVFLFTILGDTHKYGRWYIDFILFINLVTYIVTVATIYTQCDPRKKLWEPTTPGNCNGINRGYYWAIFTGAWAAFTDISIALYPIYVVMKLQMRWTTKLLLCCLMGMGVFTAVCSIVKTANYPALRQNPDPTYNIAVLMLWGNLEMWVVLIAASAAPLWPLINHTAKQVDKSKSMTQARKMFSSQSRGTQQSQEPQQQQVPGPSRASTEKREIEGRSRFSKLSSHLSRHGRDRTPSSQNTLADDSIDVKTEIDVWHENRSQTEGLPDNLRGLDFGPSWGGPRPVTENSPV